MDASPVQMVSGVVGSRWSRLEAFAPGVPARAPGDSAASSQPPPVLPAADALLQDASAGTESSPPAGSTRCAVAEAGVARILQALERLVAIESGHSNTGDGSGTG